ncbi:MAG: hypothetical protein KBA61_11580 [Spirochaetes bacterium]|nr:hypothetical protein [Spirochaetota bacterium]
MKKLLVVAGLVLFSLSCGGGSSSSGSGDYILQPGSLTTTTMNTNYDVSFAGGPDGIYAVVYRGSVNGVNYVSISIDSDGNPSDNSGLNIKIYFEASSIPTSPITLTKGLNGFSIKAKVDTTTYSVIDDSDNNITLTFEPVNSNNIIRITASDTITMTGSPNQVLTINEINAYYYNTSQ